MSLFTPSEFSKKREHPEYHETVRCSDWLKGQIHIGKNVIKQQVPFQMEFTHFPAEGAYGKEGFFAKRMGVRSSIHDFLFWFAVGQSGFIEMKAIGNVQSSGQRDFDGRLAKMGFKHRAVCYTTEEVRDTLISWGLPYTPINIPPRKMTYSEQFAMQAEIYRK